MKRRTFSFVATGMLATSMFCSPARAQEYPNRAMRIVTPIAPGGLADRVTRLMAKHLSERIGQAVIVDNKPGAGGIIALDSLAKSPPDGYTLGFTFLGPSVVNPILVKKLPYDNSNDLIPVARIASINPFVLVVSPAVPANNLAEFVAHAKASPGKLFYGSAGNASLSHLTMELFNRVAGLNLQHVPYKGEAPMAGEVLSGRLQASFMSVEFAAPLIKSGRLKAVGVANKRRSSQLPEVPTIAEAGWPEFSAAGFFGFLAPAGTPASQIKRLNEELRAIVSMPSVREDFYRFGIEPITESPEAFGQVLLTETEKWTKLVKETGIKGD